MSSKDEVTAEFFRHRSATKMECDEYVQSIYRSPKPATIQGQQSYTLIHSNKAVQFRIDELDMAIWSQAQRIFGDLVPNCSRVATFKDLSVYIADKINGPCYMTWILGSKERRGNRNVIVDLAK